MSTIDKLVFGLFCFMAAIGCRGTTASNGRSAVSIYETYHYINTYDEDSLLTRVVIYDSISDGTKTQLSAIREKILYYKAGELTQIDHYYHHTGLMRVLEKREIFGDEYTILEFGGNDTLLMECFRYDEVGNLIYERKRRKEVFDDVETPTGVPLSVPSLITDNEIHYSYDEKNRLSKAITFVLPNKLKTEVLYEYDGNDRLRTITSHVDGENSQQGTFTYEYSQDTLITKTYSAGILDLTKKRMFTNSGKRGYSQTFYLRCGYDPPKI